MKTTDLLVAVQVDAQHIVDTLMCGVETGYISYWAKEITSYGSIEKAIDEQQYTGYMEVIVDERTGKTEMYAFTKDTIQNGIELFAKNHNILELNPEVGDAETSDLLWQYILFGEQVYA